MRVLLGSVLLYSVLLYPLQASVVQPSDGPYFRFRPDDGTLYIYDQSTREFMGSLVAFNASFRAMYTQSYGWALDEEENLVLASPRQQVANAYATVFPRLTAVWFPSGAGMLEEMGEASWLLALASHETAHLYQLNAKGSRFTRYLGRVFGNTPFLFPFLWPLFPQPNILLPSSLLEGNAVLNESRLNLGGRLHSGEKRAVVLAQVAAGMVDASFLINDQFKFPFGESAYLQGGYFQSHLAGKFGVDQTNRFFLAQSGHYLWPLILDNTFREHFGSGFYEEVAEHVREMEALARRQRQVTDTEPLDHALFTGALNSDGSRVWWLSSGGSEPPSLHIYDKASGTLHSRRVDLPIGKVFFDSSGAPLSAASFQHNLHRIEYSLYGEGARFDERYRGVLVTDQRAGHTVGLDMVNSWLDPRAVLDGENYDIAHSNPILDDGGHVYYFRQNGSERLLYRDRASLGKFAGFYGKLTEAAADGSVYFIGNTDTGSTLYRWRSGEITRMFESDRIVDARMIAHDLFLVNEVGARGHRFYAVAARPESAQTPAVYAYPFAPQNVVPSRAIDDSQIAADELPYSSLRELGYSSTDFTAYYGRRFALSTVLHLTDPLQYQDVSAGFSWADRRDRQAHFEYSFTKYLPRLYTRYVYNETWYRRYDGADSRTHNQSVLAGMELPLLRWRRWDAAADLALMYKREQPSLERQPEDEPRTNRETAGAFSLFKLAYSVPTPIGYYPWRDLELTYANKLDAVRGVKAHNTSSAGVSYRHAFPNDFYASGTVKVAWAENPDIRVGFNPALRTDPEIRIERLTDADPLWVKNAGFFRLEISKALISPLYSKRFPVGLHRVVPLLIAQDLVLDSDSAGHHKPNIPEGAYGAEFELLLFHKLPARLRVVNAIADDDSERRSSLQFTLKLTGGF